MVRVVLDGDKPKVSARALVRMSLGRLETTWMSLRWWELTGMSLALVGLDCLWDVGKPDVAARA